MTKTICTRTSGQTNRKKCWKTWSNPCTGLDRSWGFQTVKACRFWDKIVRLSALPTSCLYHPGNLPGTHFCWEAESTPGPQCDWKDYVNEKFQWHHRELNSRPDGLQHSASSRCATTGPNKNTNKLKHSPITIITTKYNEKNQHMQDANQNYLTHNIRYEQKHD